MKIYEIPADGTVSLKLTKNHKSSEVVAVVNKILGSVVILKPVIIEEKVLIFDNEENLIIDLIYSNGNDKPLIWKGINYKVINFEGYSCLAISSKKEGNSYNRRESFRLDMDVQGILNRNESIIVHDISNSGISFYISTDKKKAVGDEIHIKFVGAYEDIAVVGQIVREVRGDNRILYGCTIKKNMQVEAFVANEQRRRISVKRKQKKPAV